MEERALAVLPAGRSGSWDASCARGLHFHIWRGKEASAARGVMDCCRLAAGPRKAVHPGVRHRERCLDYQGGGLLAPTGCLPSESGSRNHMRQPKAHAVYIRKTLDGENPWNNCHALTRVCHSAAEAAQPHGGTTQLQRETGRCWCTGARCSAAMKRSQMRCTHTTSRRTRGGACGPPLQVRGCTLLAGSLHMNFPIQSNQCVLVWLPMNTAGQPAFLASLHCLCVAYPSLCSPQGRTLANTSCVPHNTESCACTHKVLSSLWRMCWRRWQS